MAHVRETITLAAITALTGLTTTGSRVFRDRDTDARPLQSNEVPGLTIEDDGDPSERITIDSSDILERTMRLRVSAHVKSTSGYSALLNTILAEVETAIAGATITGSKLATLVSVGQREQSESSDQPTVRQAFDFEILYYTAAGAPTTAI